MAGKKTDSEKKTDRYIKDAPEYARPIMEKIRKAVHKGCPQAEEAIKWGCPYFMYKGKLFCGMAAFKKHVGFGFWNSADMDDPEGLFETGTGKKASMCNARFHSAKELPTQKVLVDYVKQSKKLTDAEVAKSKAIKKKTVKKKVVVPKPPADLTKAFRSNKTAKTYFDSLAPSHRRDFLQWILDAKRETTKEKRIEETIKLLKAEKTLHWKYQSKTTKK